MNTNQRYLSGFLVILLCGLLGTQCLTAALKGPASVDTQNSSADAPSDIIPDWWLKQYKILESGTSIASKPVPWSDGQLTYLQAFQQSLNPNDYYEAWKAKLVAVSGSAQLAAPRGFAPRALVVKVTNNNGDALPDAPVIFKITSHAGGRLQRTNLTKPATNVTALTDANGVAKAFFIGADTPKTDSTVAISAGTSKTIIYDEASDDGTRTDKISSPFGATNVVGTLNSDGSEDMTWENNVDPNDKTPIPVWHWNSDTKQWFKVTEVPAGTTTYHMRPNPTLCRKTGKGRPTIIYDLATRDKSYADKI